MKKLPGSRALRCSTLVLLLFSPLCVFAQASENEEQASQGQQPKAQSEARQGREDARARREELRNLTPEERARRWEEIRATLEGMSVEEKQALKDRRVLQRQARIERANRAGNRPRR